jgi:hypothetical protein
LLWSKRSALDRRGRAGPDREHDDDDRLLRGGGDLADELGLRAREGDRLGVVALRRPLPGPVSTVFGR